MYKFVALKEFSIGSKASDDLQTVKEGEEFTPPAGWVYDTEYSALPGVGRPFFSFETKRRVRNVKTGTMEWERDTKRVGVPVEVIEVSSEKPAPVND